MNDGRCSRVPGRVLASLVLWAVTSAVASAASLVLYEGENFTGRSLAVDNEIWNLDRARFNDRAGSMVVYSGTWELCTDARFEGNCRMFPPGEYASLGRLQQRVSSLREVSDRRGPPPYGDGREPVVLYEGEDLTGRSMAIPGDMPNLDGTRFNDRARSIWVRRGVWELCTDAGYSGRCARLGPGRHGSLPGGLSGRLSSLRDVGPGRAEGPPPPVFGGGGGYPRGGPAITLFSSNALDGRSIDLDGPVANLDRVGFNDRTWSIRIYQGAWEVCTDADFRGQCVVLDRGDHTNLPPGVGGRISSLRPASSSGWRPATPASTGNIVQLFSAPDFRGQSLAIGSSSDDLAALGFNDRASSMVIHEGDWEACEHAGFGGRCAVYGPGEYRSLGPQSDRISSIRRVR